MKLVVESKNVYNFETRPVATQTVCRRNFKLINFSNGILLNEQHIFLLQSCSRVSKHGT